MVGLNRPAILELSLPGEEKRNVLLVGTEHGDPVFRFNQDMTFKLEEVLSYWQGYYLLLWKPSHPGMDGIYAQETSDDVLWLRQQLGRIDGTTEKVKQPLFFDDTLKERVKKFQSQRQLIADGAAGPRTIIHLQNAVDTENTPSLVITE